MNPRAYSIFLAIGAVSLAACAGTPQARNVSAPLSSLPADLEAQFRDPPSQSRPRTWWHWTGGNVTKEGITRDLQWMKEIGLGGIQLFDVSLDTPQVVDTRIEYMSPRWQDAFRHARDLANDLDLEFAIASSAGWSLTGGPWVPPADGMKKLVWSNTVIGPNSSEMSGAIRLPALPRTVGPYQAMEREASFGSQLQPVPETGDRIAVLAFPIENHAAPAAFYTLGSQELPGELLTDGAFHESTSIDLAAAQGDGILADYGHPQHIRSVSVFLPGLERPFAGIPYRGVLETETQSGWEKIVELPLSHVPTIRSFPEVQASKFRLRIVTVPQENSEAAGAPGAEQFSFPDPAAGGTLQLAELALSGEPLVDFASEKAGHATALDYAALSSDDDSSTGPALTDIADLSGLVGPDGSLDWEVPDDRNWRIIQFGWSLTGKTNHPTLPEATGLEVDKFDADAVRRYLTTYLDRVQQAAGPIAIDALLTDSIEVGAATWTPGLEQEFLRRRGYSMRPYLPALAGFVIGSRAQTDRFLFDWRDTLAELLTDKHYATIADIARERGVTLYGEALEDKRPVLGDDLAMRSHADIPMAALWTWPEGGSPRATMIGDMKGAASVAHFYGKPLVAAESMTSINAPWAFAPRDLRKAIDLEFASGVNRTVIHTSVHQPLDDFRPGLSLAVFGQYFNRHETWAPMARAWIDYIARNSFLLQQGRNVADIAWFIGDEAPVTAQFARSVPAGLPQGRGYDFLNAEMLGLLEVDGGYLRSPGGASYRALQLGGAPGTITMATLEHIGRIARAGIPVVGPRPSASPSLADDQRAFARLVGEIWSLDNVRTSGSADTYLTGAGVDPDYTWNGGPGDSDVLFTHRSSGKSDIYFVSNRQDRAIAGTAHLRATGRKPRFFDAVTGEVTELSWKVHGQVTAVPLELAAGQSAFVVFEEPTAALSGDVPILMAEEFKALADPWTVSFAQQKDAPPALEMAALYPLNESVDPAVRYFSGIATYRSEFALDDVPQGRIFIDLGTVADVAAVKVNGQDIGTTWFAPDRLDVSDALVPGINRIEIEVANLWVNRLIGDRQPGADPVTQTATMTYNADAPLRPSGLIGPVRLLVSPLEASGR